MLHVQHRSLHGPIEINISASRSVAVPVSVQMESCTIYFRADESCTIYFYFLEFYRIRTRGLGTQMELNEVRSVFHDTTTLYTEEDWENK